MPVTIAAEDALSASVAARLIARYAPQSAVARIMVLGGINNLKARMRDLTQIAGREDLVLVLADLDRPEGCPPARVRELSGGLTIAPNLLLRIAVLEIESWILADRYGMARWLEIAPRIIPQAPETLIDPKRTMVQLAARSPNRALREGIAPVSVRGTHRTGPGYNALAGEFVTQLWNPDAARRIAPSLDRAIIRISEMAAL